MDPTTNPPAATTPATAVAPTAKKKERTYDVATFCDIAGAPHDVRFLGRKKFSGQEKTLPEWVKMFAAAGVTVSVPK